MSTMTLPELIQKHTAARAKYDNSKDTLRQRIEEFELTPSIKQLQDDIASSEETMGECKQMIIDQMKEQDMQTAETEAGKATVSRKITAKWADDEALIEAIEKKKVLAPLRDFVKTIKAITEKAAFRKKLQEMIEIENPKALEEAGVELSEDVTLRITPAK